MDKLDQLIAKFKEVKEELAKNAPLHDTVEGFMHGKPADANGPAVPGLKSYPKGSAERGQFITQHMSHPSFIGALNSHPQGKQLHGMLMGHLDSKANAGPKGPMKTSVGGASVTSPATPKPIMKAEDDLEEFGKAYISPYFKHGPSKPKATAPTIVAEDKTRAAALGAPSNPEAPKPVVKDEDDVEKALGSKSMTGRMLGGGATALTHPDHMGRANMLHDAAGGAYQPAAPAAPAAAPAKKLTGLDRIRAESQKPLLRSETEDKKWKAAEFGKTINSSYAPQTNGMAMSCDEKVTLNKGGQWNLDKAYVSPYYTHGPSKPKPAAPKPAPAAPEKPLAKNEELAKDVGTVAAPPKFANMKGAPAGIGHAPGAGATYGSGGYQITQPFPQPKASAISSPRDNIATRASSPRAQVANDARTQVPLGGEVPQGHVAAPPTASYQNQEEQTHAGLPPHLQAALAAGHAADWTNAGPPPRMPAGNLDATQIRKGECAKCHADPCECQTTGVLVDKAE